MNENKNNDQDLGDQLQELEKSWTGPTQTNVQGVYVLYLLGFVLGGLSSIVGLIFAYINHGKGNAVLDSHYRYQIRTFWIGFLYSMISLLLSIILIGFLMLAGVAVWMIIRCIKGLQASSAGKPIANPETWWV